MRLVTMKHVRRELGLKQGDLARLVGKSQQKVSLVENGLEITRTEAEEFARELNCDVTDLTGQMVAIPLTNLVVK